MHPAALQQKIKSYNENMDNTRIKEENKYFTGIIVTAGGVAGLIISGCKSLQAVLLLIAGLYILFAFITKFQFYSYKIENNIRKIKE